MRGTAGVGGGGWPARRLRDVGRLRAVLLDVLLGALAAYAAVVLALAVTPDSPSWPARAAVLVAFLHGSTIVLRRAATAVMLAAMVATAVGYTVLGYPVFLLGPAVLIAAYTVGTRWPRRRALVALAAVDGATIALIAIGSSFPGVDSVVFFVALITAAWFLGDIVRRWQTLAREHAAQVVQLQAARDELARHAVTAERLRLARELHDVVAHGLSIVAMHAGAGRLAVVADPPAGRAALEVIEQTTRAALGEMRRLVAVLREQDAGAGGLSAVHGLGELAELIAGVAAAGVSIEVRTSGDLTALPDGVSLAGYRVVQEALTNVVRHAGPTRARVNVAAGPEGSLDIRVENDPGLEHRKAGPAGGGHGTAGMQERVELYGGTVLSEPTPDGGWRVTARVPADPLRAGAQP